MTYARFTARGSMSDVNVMEEVVETYVKDGIVDAHVGYDDNFDCYAIVYRLTESAVQELQKRRDILNATHIEWSMA